MAEKEASQSEAAAGIDFLALEMEIDREIDSLFVPAVKRAQGTTEAPKVPGKPAIFPNPRPAPDRGICRKLRRRLRFRRPSGRNRQRNRQPLCPCSQARQDEKPVQTGSHEQPKRAQRTAEEPKAAGKTSDFPNPGPATASRNRQEARATASISTPSGRDR